jgi:5-formyltetrahydrofolate cyclo-ligase
MNSIQIKKMLRKSILKKRNSLSKSEIKEKSEIIKNLILNLNDFKKAKTTLFYISYGSEVFTHDLIIDCLKSDKNVVVPKTLIEEKKINISRLTDWSHLNIGAYNILEPKRQYFHEVDFGSLDLILIPGVAFDINGNRIGHGNGYYDRFLKKIHNSTYIGLAYDFQIVDSIPAESHDILLDMIITEKRVIYCKN